MQRFVDNVWYCSFSNSEVMVLDSSPSRHQSASKHVALSHRSSACPPRPPPDVIPRPLIAAEALISATRQPAAARGIRQVAAAVAAAAVAAVAVAVAVAAVVAVAWWLRWGNGCIDGVGG
ncbi:Protein of unknown function [Gryllus bimaculatus]|nr:Protein of unknown function [Gryllus bimaculatus]